MLNTTATFRSPGQRMSRGARRISGIPVLAIGADSSRCSSWMKDRAFLREAILGSPGCGNVQRDMQHAHVNLHALGVPRQSFLWPAAGKACKTMYLNGPRTGLQPE